MRSSHGRALALALGLSLGLGLCAYGGGEARAQTAAPPMAAPHDEQAHEEAHAQGESGAGARAGAAGGGARDVEAIPGFRRAAIPANSAEESASVPAGTVRIHVVDPRGNPLEGVAVHLGMLREGESAGGRDGLSGTDGLVQFDGLRTGMGVAYRAFTENDGAKFSAPPFVLSSTAGEEVRLVRFPVEHEPRGVLLSDLRVEIAFQDDRLVVVVRASLVNFTSMSLDGREPRPVAFVPRDGVRFRLPTGYSVFRSDERSMGDQRVTEDNGYAVLRGSFIPSAPGETFEATFQFRVKLDGRTEIPLELELPNIPVLRAMVATQAPVGMRLEVEGMGPAQERTHNGQRVLLTGAQRQSREDAEISRIRINLRGIPAPAGTSRTVAAVSALAIVLLSLLSALHRVTRGASAAEARAMGSDALRELRGERERLLRALRELGDARQSGDVGPETFARQKRALVEELALVLRALETAAPTPAVTA